MVRVGPTDVTQSHMVGCFEVSDLGRPLNVVKFGAGEWWRRPRLIQASVERGYRRRSFARDWDD
jgi:hypothetical protein